MYSVNSSVFNQLIIMNKKIIAVPAGIRKLSEWNDFLNFIPQGKVIVNKRLTGCGATTLFLKINRPLILCAHRSELLSCKAESDMHKNEVHLFKDADDMGKVALANNMARLHQYLNQFKQSNPFTPQLSFSPKILVTADSLHHVIDVLTERGELNEFSAVSDEMQCIFTDASFKGDVVLNYLNSLRLIDNVVLLSATPYLERYLDEIPEFQNLPYIELDWESEEPNRVMTPDIRKKKVVSLGKELDEIIARLKTTGYFETKTISGVPYKAEQGVFYLNSVDDIVSAIKRNGLSPNECNVICSRSNSKNLAKLKRVGFVIGSPQKEGEVHKPYTFVTRCAFEGVDMYHPSGYTYIFADPNLNNLALDISIDIEQIMGRQRLDSNVFKYNATMFFKTTNGDRLEDSRDFAQHIQSKIELTQLEMTSFSNLSGRARSYKIGQVNSAHQQSGFQFDYLSFCQNEITKEWEPKENFLVKMSEIRAWDIRNNNFADEIQVISGMNTICSKSPLSQLLDVFDSTKDFIVRLRAYCEFLDAYPDAQDEVEQKSVGVIDYEFHQFYRVLGHNRIKANLYQRSKLINLMDCEMAVDKIESMIKGVFKVGDVIPRDEAKKRLQEIYDNLGLKKTAKATDLDEYFDTRRALIKGINSIRLVGLHV